MKRMKEMKLLFAFAALFMTVAMFSGCGSKESDSGGPDVQPVEDAAWTGNCTICHTYEVHTNISGIAGVNSDTLGRGSAITHECEACHGGGQYHHGDGPIPFPSPGGDRCATCHEVANDVLASKHNGEEADNVAMIASGHDTGKCQRCHTAEGSRAFATIIGNKTAYDVIYSYGATPTAGQTTEALPNLDADGNHILHNPVCATCHNPLTKEPVSIAGWDPNGNAQFDQFDLCTSCHVYNLNNNGTLIGSGLPLQNGAGDATEAFYHDTAWYRVLLSTHYDNPDTGFVGSSGETQTLIEGYNIRKNSANPCFDCHGHNLLTNTGNLTRPTGMLGYVQNPDVEPTIYTDWAKSAHAGGLLKVKYASQENGDRETDNTLKRNARLTQIVTDAAADDTTGPAWTHYNWDRTGRSSCQRCHTSTGAMNYLNNPAGYVAANNNFSHLSGWTGNEANGSPQNEMLYCWGCHSNAAAGVLRTPGAITETYADGVVYTYPNIAGSNVCMACHIGRESGGSIVASTSNFNNVSFINSHYLTAGGTVFTVTGYEFTGRDYTSPSFYQHQNIGGTAPGTGANGPCVGCHMSTPESHLFLPVEKDEVTGAITAVTSTVCSACHPGGEALAMSPAMLEGQKALLAAAMDALKAQLQNINGSGVGYYFYESHPYFFTAPYNTGYTETGNCTDNLGVKNWQTGGTSTFTWSGTSCTSALNVAGTAGTGKDNMGAAFNYNLIKHDPGAFAHNRYYAKRLIYDAIDWADDNNLNYTTGATLDALPGGTLYKADAMTYLLVNGTPTGSASERP